MTVVTLRSEPIRAIVIKARATDHGAYLVEMMARGSMGARAVRIGQSFGAPDIEAAMECARSLRQRHGLPILDLSRGAPEPSLGGTA